MSKTELTKSLEKSIWNATNKMGTFGCFEVTIGWFGKERVDYMTYDTKGIFRCYEIKVSESDFRSNNHNTFVGHLNYYVLTSELYDKVKFDIPKGIGVFLPNTSGMYCEKRATKRECEVDEQVLKNSLIRSLSRDVQKYIKSSDDDYVNGVNRRIAQLNKQAHQKYQDYLDLLSEVQEIYGYNWRHPERNTQQ